MSNLDQPPLSERSKSLPGRQPISNYQQRFIAKHNSTAHTIDSISSGATTTTTKTFSSILLPKDETRRNLLISKSTKEEEMLWRKYQDERLLRSVHEIHMLGGTKADVDIHKARERFLKKTSPNNHLELNLKLNMQDKYLQWKLREEELDREEEMRKADIDPSRRRYPPPARTDHQNSNYLQRKQQLAKKNQSSTMNERIKDDILRARATFLSKIDQN